MQRWCIYLYLIAKLRKGHPPPPSILVILFVVKVPVLLTRIFVAFPSFHEIPNYELPYCLSSSTIYIFPSLLFGLSHCFMNSNHDKIPLKRLIALICIPF